MKTLISLFVVMLFTVNYAFGQIEFSKFKFSKDSPFGMAPTRKMTDTKFKVTAEKPLKYIKVWYYGVNQVNDVVSSDIVGAVNANKEHTKYRMIKFTGPFEPGKKYSQWASGTFYYPLKLLSLIHI